MHPLTVNIRDHGARGDGKTLDTPSLQAALDRVERAGGGTVQVPAGVFLTGTLRLPSHLRLHLAEDAVLLASPQLNDYPALPFQHDEWGATTSLLFARDREDIHLEGPGTIDLNDDAFMDRSQIKTGDHFTADKVAQLTPAQREQTTCVPRPRPVQPIFFHACRRVSIRNLTLRRSPCWSLTLSDCEDIAIRSVRIRNHLRTPNSDGIHLCGCRRAVISHCDLSCGDDCIALTGITDWSRPCEHIEIHHCRLQSASAAVRLGHLRSTVREVLLQDLKIVASNRGIGIFAGDGGCVERVRVQRVQMQTQLTAGHWWGGGEPLVLCAADAPTARIRDVRFEQVTAHSEQGILAVGTAGNIHDVVLRDWTQTLAPGPHRPLLGDVLDLRPARLRRAPLPPAIPWLNAQDIGALTACRLRVHFPPAVDPAALLSPPSAVTCHDLRLLPGDDAPRPPA